jgi:proline iminopeptidase
MVEGYVEVEGGLRLYYRRVGEGPEGVVISAGSWLLEDFGALAREDRSLVFFDARGRGGSDRVTEAGQVADGYGVRDLEAVRKALGFERMAVVGWSIGGTEAARYAAEYGERVSRLVMMCPGYVRSEAPWLDWGEIGKRGSERMPEGGEERLDEMKREGLDVSEPEMYCREHQKVWLVRQMGRPEALGEMRSRPCRYENEWPRNLVALMGLHGGWGSYDWREMAGRIGAPTLVVHGAEDLIPVESAREWAESIAGAELAVIEGAGHYPHLERAEVFFERVEGFLG